MSDEVQMPMINPEIVCMYQWHFHEDESEAWINIPLPSTDFDVERVQVSLSEAGNTILIEIPGEIPILEGTLLGAVKSFSREIAHGHIVVKLIKSDPGIWGLAIVGSDPSTNTLDPKSAFDLFDALGKSGTSSSSKHLIEFAIAVGYPPALLVAFHASQQRDERAKKQGLALLMIAANTYEDPVALLTLGNHLAMREETRDDAFNMYSRAAKQGALLGLSMMGQIISPLSDIPFHHKNAAQAAELFEAVLQKTDDVIAMSELSKLLYNGVGVTRDVARAQMLDAKAREVEPELPPLTQIGGKPEHSPFLSVYQGLTIASFACAGLYVFYRIWKGRQTAGPKH